MKVSPPFLEEIQPREAQGKPLGEGEGIGDRYPHVRNPHLGDDGAIHVFHHGMDDALRVNLDSDLFNGHIEKPVGLDHFESFVHERGGVDGDLFPHLPVGMMEGIFDRHLVKFRRGRLRKGPPEAVRMRRSISSF